MKFLHFYVNMLSSVWTGKFMLVVFFTLFYMVSVGTTKTNRFAQYLKNLRTEVVWEISMLEPGQIHDGMIVDRREMDYWYRNVWKVRFLDAFLVLRDGMCEICKTEWAVTVHVVRLKMLETTSVVSGAQ